MASHAQTPHPDLIISLWRALYIKTKSRHTEIMLPETFRTARLFLRPIAMADAGPIFAAYARNPEVTRFLIWRPN